MRSSSAALIKQLPRGWEDAERHIESATRLAGDTTREVPPTEMFVFVRELMRFPWADDWRDDPERIADLIEQVHAWRSARFREFERKTADDPGLGDFWEFNLPHSGGREEFIALWLGMRYPPGADPLQLALADATQSPVQVEGPRSLIYQKVISIAFHLQRRAGDRDIALPQERIARLLNVSQRIISAYLTLAVRRGLLRPVAGHNHAAKLAKRYRFVE